MTKGRRHTSVSFYKCLPRPHLLLSLLRLSRLELLLHLLDDAEGRVQVGGGRGDLAGLLRVRTAVGAADEYTQTQG